MCSFIYVSVSHVRYNKKEICIKRKEFQNMEIFFCTKDSPVVEVKQGKIKGYFFDGVYRFLGVPYAKAQRFMMPEEPDHWDGIKDCLAYGKICPILLDPTPHDEIQLPHRY